MSGEPATVPAWNEIDEGIDAIMRGWTIAAAGWRRDLTVIPGRCKASNYGAQLRT
jgi:hypothetical protein